MIFWTIVGTSLFSLLSLAVYIFYQRRGQFDQQEEVKYQIFRD